MIYKKNLGDGTIEWRNENGELHRIDGPAVIYPRGTQSWWLNHKRHRLDGPAIIRVDGTQEWYVNDKLHRLDGPAIIWSDKIQEWYVKGKKITEEVKKWMTQMNITYPFTDEEKVLFAVRFA